MVVNLIQLNGREHKREIYQYLTDVAGFAEYKSLDISAGYIALLASNPDIKSFDHPQFTRG